MKKGFTLLELLVTVSIIGILMSIAVVAYSSVQKRSRDSRRISDMKAVQAAYEQYYLENNAYPETVALIDSTYLPEGYPTDPKNTGTYIYYFTDGRTTTTAYCFCATLEVTVGNAASRPGTYTCTFGSGSYYCVGNLQ